MFNPVIAYIRTIGVFNFILRAIVLFCMMFLTAVIFACLLYIFGF